MLHSYVERVWSFGYVFSWEFIHYWSGYAQKNKKKKTKKNKKKNVLFIISFSIEHMYECASLLDWVYVLERVRMRTSLWDSILVYFGWEYDLPVRFCERDERPFFSIHGSLLYPSFRLFQMWLFSMLWCELTITHFSISSSSSILFYSSVSLHFILSHSFLILLDVWHEFSIRTSCLLIRCDYSFIITFRVGTLKSGTRDVFYTLHLMHEGYGGLYHWDLWA